MSEKAIFAAWCFLGVQEAFDKVESIISTIVGYTGGLKKYKNPSYKLVCSGKTKNAEAIQIDFDPKKVSYEKLLEVFWKIHNPTTFNRQGFDIGDQYRSAIFYFTEKQRKLALKSLKKHQKKFNNKIVTGIVKTTTFYPAEEYHQKYYKRHSVLCHWEYEKYVEKILKRFGNVLLKDQTKRLTMGQIRKLKRNERLIWPAFLALNYGLEPVNICKSIGFYKIF